MCIRDSSSGVMVGHSSGTAQSPTNLWVPRDMSRERKGERTLTGGRRPKSAGGSDRGMHRGADKVLPNRTQISSLSESDGLEIKFDLPQARE